MITNYQFITRVSDNVIVAVNQAPAGTPSPWKAISGETYHSLTFDTVAGADITTPNGKPVPGDFYNGVIFTPLTPGSYLALSWEGAGVPAADMREMVADGVNSETIRLTKKEIGTDTPQVAASDNDEYRVCVRTSVGKPSVGKIALVNGTATFTVTPSATEKGICEIELIPIAPAVSPTGRLAISFI